MSEETIGKVLSDFGLTGKETEVYIFLAKCGVLKGGEIAKRIRVSKAQVYHILKSLQSKGLVESTLESPARFVAVPFETVLDLYVKTRQEEAALIESSREDMLRHWDNISKPSSEPMLEKFVVIEGNHKIYPRLSKMIKDAKNRFSAVSSVAELMRASQHGVLDNAFNHQLRSKVQFRLITDVTEQNLSTIKALLEQTPKTGFNFRGRNPNLGLALFPRMVIRDDEEILYFVSGTDAPVGEAVCLWTNCSTLVQSFTVIFEELWRNATDIQAKILEIEAGRPTPTTQIIVDKEMAKSKYYDSLYKAREEVIMVASSESLLEYENNTPLLEEWAKNGISVKIMAPITSENLKAALELSQRCDVRHVHSFDLETTLIDGNHLFQFKVPLSNQERSGETLFLKNIQYTNDREYLDKTKNMLDDIWRNAQPPSATTLGSVMGIDAPTTVTPRTHKPIEIARKVRGIHYDEEKPSGELTEKDILDRILNFKKNPVTVSSKDIMTHYCSSGVTLVHPPKDFNLPDIQLFAAHIDEYSPYDARANVLWVYLRQETPKGSVYMPGAYVVNNAKFYDNYWRRIFAGTPICGQLVREDELQVRIHGNTLFACWTVPIPLFQSQYALPPSCALFEGYGDIRTWIFNQAFPSGFKCKHEINYFEAFVTYLHPASKYQGPGTESLLFRDVIITTYPPETSVAR